MAKVPLHGIKQQRATAEFLLQLPFGKFEK